MADVIQGWYGPMMVGQTERTLFGPMIKASILDPGWSGDGEPTIAVKDVVALIDTGAQNCAIASRVAKRLNLKVLKDGTVYIVGSPNKTQSYMGHIAIPEIGKIYGFELLGAELPEDRTPFEIILGAPFLKYFSLSLSSNDDRVLLTRE